MQVIGTAQAKIDGMALVTGKPVYTSDLELNHPVSDGQGAAQPPCFRPHSHHRDQRSPGPARSGLRAHPP